MRTQRVILPHATESDWSWREYKAYVAICGDYVECEVFMSKAVAITSVKPVTVIGARPQPVTIEQGERVGA